MATKICIRIPDIPDKLEIELPAIGPLTFLRDSLDKMPRISELILKFLNNIAPSLSPIFTILRILDLLIALVKCSQAAKDAVTSLSPKPIIECLEKLIKALAQLIPMFPPISYVKLVVDIVRALRLLLDDMLNVLVQIDAQISEIKRVLTKAMEGDDDILLEIGKCSQNDMEQASSGIIQILEVIGKLLFLVIQMLEIIEPTLFEPLRKKVRDFRKRLEEFPELIEEIKQPSEFPPLKKIADFLAIVVALLSYIEQIGSAFLGLQFEFRAFELPEFQNP